MRSSSASSSDHLAALERPDDLGGQVVGGRAQAAAGDDQVDARAAGSAAPRHVLGPVADDRDVGEVDAELAQALGQPRPVAVGDPAGEDLGPGDDDARAGAHAAVRPLRRAEHGRPCA